MPNASVHFLLAGRVLDRWRESPSAAPFPLDDAACVDAFHYGCVAPDLGYFPSGERLFSELVHLVRSADLARSLVRRARSDTQRAYAWGWATHLLADQAIHPLINQSAWELVAGTRDRPVDAPQDDRSHMRVEFGLDIEVFRRHPRLEGLRLGGSFERSGAEHLAGAMEETYGWRMDPGPLLRSHQVTARVVRGCILLNRVATARLRHRPLHTLTRLGLSLLAPPTRLLPESYGPAPLLCAVLDPLPPPRWLIEEVERVLEGFVERFEPHYATALRELQNYDLTTGELASPEPSHPRARQALAALAGRGRSEERGARSVTAEDVDRRS